MFIPDPGFHIPDLEFSIPDPGSRIQGPKIAPDPGTATQSNRHTILKFLQEDSF
jgi:hypothetical protein